MQTENYSSKKISFDIKRKDKHLKDLVDVFLRDKILSELD